MRTEIINMTPRKAREFLKANKNNRPLRPAHVERLRSSFERGEYVMTHQGIAFCDDDTLADGQHRLHAISLLPDTFCFPMLVTYGLKREEAFPVIDIVNATRSVGDVLGVDRKLAEVGMFLCRLWEGRSTKVTPTQARPFIELTAATTSDLLKFCGSTSKTWSSASVRTAAVVSIMNRGDADYVKLMYRNLVTADFNSMTPLVASLFKSHLSGKVRATDANDLFVRCLRAFEPTAANNTKVQIKDMSADLEGVRLWLSCEFAKKNASDKAEAKGKAPANYMRRAA